MNVIMNCIIGNHNDIRRFIYDNIQINDPTEEDYNKFVNFLIENGYFKENLCSFYYSRHIKCFYYYEQELATEYIR